MVSESPIIEAAMAKNNKAESQRREVQEQSLLFEISQTLGQAVDLQELVAPLLAAMAQQMGMLRGTLTLLNRETGEIFIDAAHGLSPSQQQRGRYKLGEGVIGKVISTGKATTIPRISQDPRFLNRTGARERGSKKEFSFICVPIRLGREVIGALSVDREFKEGASLDEDVRLLSIIAAMIAVDVRLQQSVQEERQRLLQENARLQEELKERFRPANIIGNSNAMQAVYSLIDRVAKSDATVLIRGESGTGKELVAQAIHYHSLRAARPFVRVHCAALPETVIESELFGHEKGAFTGAIAERKGRFELAHGGTLLLDEVGDLSVSTQIKLLRVLQEKEFERVGGTETIKTDVRVIAATNRDLEEQIAAGTFREDLYYRLNVFPIHVPPLRERRTDIPLLADFFVERYSQANHKHIARISTPAIDMLMSYHWPGNVRELENCIERAALLTNEDVVHAHHLPPTLQMPQHSGALHEGTLQSVLDSVERDLIVDALKASRGNKAEAARVLGLTERIMGLRVDKHAIDPRRFRTSR